MTDVVESAKQRMREIYASGSYRDIAVSFLPMAAHLVASVGVRPGERVLDVACGTGIVALTARRAGADVVGVDLSPEMVAIAREEAATAGEDGIDYRVADAEALPFEDASFDVVLSSFGVMYAPRPDVAARELLRVARPGARVAITAWPPGSLTTRGMVIAERYLPPPAAAPPSPLLWGREDVVAERLGHGLEGLTFERGVISRPVMSPRHFWRGSSEKGGSLVRVVDALRDEPERLRAFEEEFVALTREHYRDNQVHQEYLLARGVRT